MKALVLKEYNRFVYEDVPEPEIGPEDVLIRVKACGICGSDVHGMDGSTGRRQPPIIMGHEAAGEIAKLGGRVTGWKTGDRVTFDSTIYCGRCGFCRAGQINLCDNRRVLGVSCGDYRQHGAFAEYVAVPQHILYKLPEALTFERAVLVEPLSVALHGVHRTRILMNDSAVVVGAGMVGLLVLQALRAAGCGTIVAVDIDPRRLELALRLGADQAFSPEMSDVVAEVRALTAGRGADIALEVVGITPSVAIAVACMRKGGQLTLVGNLAPKVDLPLQAVVTRELTLSGSCASRGEYPAGLEMIARGRVNVDPLISATVPLAEGASWFERLRQADEGLMKVILKP